MLEKDAQTPPASKPLPHALSSSAILSHVSSANDLSPSVVGSAERSGLAAIASPSPLWFSVVVGAQSNTPSPSHGDLWQERVQRVTGRNTPTLLDDKSAEEKRWADALQKLSLMAREGRTSSY